MCLFSMTTECFVNTPFFIYLFFCGFFFSLFFFFVVVVVEGEDEVKRSLKMERNEGGYDKFWKYYGV